MVDAVKRAGGKVRDLHEYNLLVREFGQGHVGDDVRPSASNLKRQVSEGMRRADGGT
ncbi:hypothetical protein Daura_01630 [Dactylosporangium aurantiacum]|uniref:Uncharacterized protein n=1 Tax=Dactylosporangium aurantiacum TaxID=35754 RepID=A0A9Q9MHM7_9ACTN|nr:hypothetical protein [Dactylosporangium aurantiacum]MDG6100933.1 hypothetical protein [Dactylosporangium aurantiacum]UWZ55015.1 hypothetical protein Daura_01630 [Dactylosporangium aurantiacum]